MRVRKAFAMMFVLFLALMMLSSSHAQSVQQVNAYHNPGITIVLNGQAVQLMDGGQPLTPLTYQGITYVPLIAFAQSLSLQARWDQATSTMYVGTLPGGVDLINDLPPYSIKGAHEIAYSHENRSATIAGKAYDHWLQYYSSNSASFYDLSGKYTKLHLKAFSQHGSKIIIYGDNNAVLAKIDVNANQLPEKHTIDVTNITQLTIAADYHNYIYLFDMFVE